MLKITEIKSLRNSILNEINLYRTNKRSDFSKSLDVLYAHGVQFGLMISLGFGLDDKEMRKCIGKKSFRFLKKMWNRQIGTKIPIIKIKPINSSNPKKEKKIKYQTAEELCEANRKAYLMCDDDYRKSIGLDPLPPNAFF